MRSENDGQNSNVWKPKALRPETPPNPKDCLRFLECLVDKVSKSTYDLFRRLAFQAHDERLANAFSVVIRQMQENPKISHALQQALTTEEYAGYVEVSRSDIPQKHKNTAEALLNGYDRQVMLGFLRSAFRNVKTYPHLHLFDYMEKK